MICIARIFGAPVIEPHGNSAASTSTGCAALVAVIVEVIWSSVG